MPVLHKVKRSAAKVTKASAPDNGEFLAYRQKLEGVLRTLEASSATLTQSQMMWRKMAQEEKLAANKYTTLYPDSDYVRDMGLSSAKALSEMDKDFAGMQGADSPVRQLDRLVRKHITEIKALDTDYKMVASAKIEYEIYRQKIDDLETAQKKDESRIDRNKVKLDESRMNYEGTVRATVLRQKELYPKRHTMYKTALCAYWLAQSMYVKLMEEHTKEATEYAAENMEVMLNLDVAKMERKSKAEEVAMSEENVEEMEVGSEEEEADQADHLSTANTDLLSEAPVSAVMVPEPMSPAPAAVAA